VIAKKAGNDYSMNISSPLKPGKAKGEKAV